MSHVHRPSLITSWLLATRPKTLTASLIPFLAGTTLAYSTGAPINWLFLFTALGSAFFIQFSVNLLNDAFDSKKGADTSERLGPQRALQAGVATVQQVYAAGMGCLFFALITALPIILHGGIVLLLIILVSMLCAYIYTGGPYPLAYIGLGDVFVVIFYGWVGTLSAYWLQAGIVTPLSFLLGTQIGLLATGLIAINNLRDVVGDAKVGKNTLPVRFGQSFGRFEFAVVTLLPFLLNFVWLFNGYEITASLPWLIFPLAFALVVKVYHTPPSTLYNGFLAQSALIHFGFGILLMIGFLLD
jgi:1,4-dihydroxy-2-naphthoate octaprenyltransferase